MREPPRYRPTAWEVLEDRVLPSLTDGVTSLSSVIPVERQDAYGLARHEMDLQQARLGNADVVFLGDSITDNWSDGGAAVWAQRIAPLHAANFGIGGDTTETLLWRIANGELAGQPQVVVLEIGTNNLGLMGNTVDETVEGIDAVVAAIRAVSPQSQILLMGLFPRTLGSTDLQMPQIGAVNALIAGLGHEANVSFLDIGSLFLNPDGTVSRALLPDGVHPSAQGYELWADAIVGPLQLLLGRTGLAPSPPAEPPPATATTAAPASTPTPDQTQGPAVNAAPAPDVFSEPTPDPNAIEGLLLVAPPPSSDAASFPEVPASSSGLPPSKDHGASWWQGDPAGTLE